MSAPLEYDRERGCLAEETLRRLCPPKDAADERRERLSVDRRRVSGDGASSSSL